MNLFYQSADSVLLFFPLAFGLFVSYAILRVTDLTVDGTYALGAGLFARLLSANVSPALSLIVAIVSCAAVGSIVSLIQSNHKISPLLAGILAVFALHSLNLYMMGKPNLSLLEVQTLQFSLGVRLALLVGIGLVLSLLLLSRYGLLLRAYGDSPRLLERRGFSPTLIRTAGLALSNALAGFCGVMAASYHGYADINMGFGMALIGIGTVAIGLQLAKGCVAALFATLVGALLYFGLLGFLLQVGIDPVMIKFFVALAIVALLLASKKEVQHA